MIDLSSAWVVEGVLGLFFLIFAKYGLKKLLSRLAKNHPASLWRSKLEPVAFAPLKVAFWIIAIYFLLSSLGKYFGTAAISNSLSPTRNAALICCLSWLLLRWKVALLYAYSAKHHKGSDLGVVPILSRMLTIAILIIASIFVLQSFGIDVLPLVAFGGIGAAAIGFAGKDVIANFFGGMMLYITRPFVVGDEIHLQSHQVEGHIEEIGWYLTSVRDKNKRPVYLPNAIFSNELVINISRMSHRRIEEKIGVRYEDFDKIKVITEQIRKEISAHSTIDKKLPVLVHFNAFEDHTLDIYVEAYSKATKTEDFLPVKEEILKAIYDTLIRLGAQMPYPTTRVELHTIK
jgi:MscS family membrane protein